jgi:hypothetical protein
MVEALRQAEIPVQIDILRPGTYEALHHHLQEKTTQHGVGYYHVVHFDVHGSVLSYEELQKGQQANRYLYNSRYGRADLTAYEGDKAFLFLDRYEQASTYHQLGRVAEAQHQWDQARDFFLQSLGIWVDYEDTYNTGIALRSLARLRQSSGDTTLPDAVASVLKITAAEAETRLREIVENDSDEHES